MTEKPKREDLKMLFFRTPKDAATLLIFALRYALPRKTFAPDIVMEMIENNISGLRTEDVRQFTEELDRQFREFENFPPDDIGLPEKLLTMQALRDRLVYELEERRNEEILGQSNKD